MERYQNQIDVNDFGLESQTILSKSRVLLVGLGGLGSIVAPYLVGAGVNTLTICDHDRIDIKNLHRQTIYKESDVGRYKSDIAFNYLSKLNSETKILSYNTNIQNSFDLYNPNIVIDCTDNLTTKLWLENYARDKNVPLISAGVGVYKAQIIKILPNMETTLSSVFLNVDDPDRHVVLGPVCGVIASLQSLLALQSLIGIESDYNFININLKSLDIQKIKLP